MIFALAPMDGITDLPYRIIVKKVFDKYNKLRSLLSQGGQNLEGLKNQDNNQSRSLLSQGGQDELWFWTEFMNADGYMIHPARLVRHLIYSDFDTPLFAQIYGGNEDTLIKTAQDIEKKYPGFAGIELNIGCPSPKVMSCGGGSGMMRDKIRCLEIIKNISESIHKPFSIKVRTGLNNDDKNSQFDMLCKASKYCNMISVHGRTFNQGHSNLVDWDFIYKLKKEVGNDCKIIGNGGITSYQDAMNHFVGNDGVVLDGIMIAQGAIGDPWIFVNHRPDIKELYDVIIEHLKLSVAYEMRFKKTLEQHPHDEKDAILESNKKALHYNKKIEDDDSLVDEITDVQLHNYKIPFPSLFELEKIANALDDNDSTEYRSIIEFRKYLFNYVKGIVGSKEFKQKVATIKGYNVLILELRKFLDF